MLPAADIAHIARAERKRRFAAWTRAIAAAETDARPALQARADEDHDLWLEIERWALRYAGDPVGRGDGWPRTLRAGLASVVKTLELARESYWAGKVDEAKVNDLAQLRRWLAAHLPWNRIEIEAAQQRRAA